MRLLAAGLSVAARSRQACTVARVSEPAQDPAETIEALEVVLAAARDYVRTLDAAPVRSPGANEAAATFVSPLPETGVGTLAAVNELLGDGLDAHIRSSGPRFFNWVIGGTTPAALAADWLVSLIDQNAGPWDGSPLAAQLERVSLSWLRELFGLPAGWGGVLTTGATMAHFGALTAARRWWGERHGVDVDADGLAGLPAVPVFSSGFIHPSAVKALGMLGIGRKAVTICAADATGQLDANGLESALRRLGGAPAVVIANAGEISAGHFDPIARMAELAERYGAWLHVDGAFGLFAALSPRTVALVEGIERADSVISDGHKWLNVPYDCGFAFVRDPGALAKSFSVDAAYLPAPDDERPSFGMLGPEMSRRARSLAVWATLRAYGRGGYRAIVERNLDNAAHLARRVEETPALELLAPVPLNVVCFRYRPAGIPESELDELNARIADAALLDGRVYFGTTRWAGKVAFRPVFVNWRTTNADAELVVDVVLELGRKLTEEARLAAR